MCFRKTQFFVASLALECGQKGASYFTEIDYVGVALK